MAKEEVARAARKEVVDAIRAAREAHCAQFADGGVAGTHAGVEVPFVAGADRWSDELRQALEKGDFDAARRELMTKAAAQDSLALHQLGVFDVFEPPRVLRRLFRLSQAAILSSSRLA